MSVACWMVLRLEQGVEVPERGLNITVCWHFFEATSIRGVKTVQMRLVAAHKVNYKNSSPQITKVILSPQNTVPHFQENLAELATDFEKRMQMSGRRFDSERVKVVRLERLALPRAADQQY